MARVSRAQADQHREEIAQVAARLFRERGLDGVSIAELTAAAGLTHGGFYGHFASKDALAAEAVDRAFAQTEMKWRRARDESEDTLQTLALIIGNYLSPDHRDTPGPGCAACALAGDIARAAPDKPVRASFTTGIDGLVSQLTALLGGDKAQARIKAIALLSGLAGAITLARATDGALSDEILEGARQSLIQFSQKE